MFDTNETTAERRGTLSPKGVIQRLLLALAAAILAASALYAGSGPAEAKDSLPTPSSEDSLVHQVPKVPTRIDGKSVKPAKVRDYNGRPLHTVVNPGTNLKSAEDDSVDIFTTEQKADKYAKKLADKLGRGKDQDISEQATYGEVRLYDAPSYGGWEMHLGDGNAVPDFRYLYCFIWCQNYNFGMALLCH